MEVYGCIFIYAKLSIVKKTPMRQSLRQLAKLGLKGKLTKPSLYKKSVHPKIPARTRFAPSPTGYLHLGSLRTALYNYLLAKSTNGTFILRLEDTDQNRLVPGAEQNIYESLEWTGLKPDESPVVGGNYGPYRQSDRADIYRKFADQLISTGHAYKCYCSKERLAHLRETAMQLKPPTTVTYDRRCLHNPETSAEDLPYTVRFRSPSSYDLFSDLLHGTLNLQPQYNLNDRRYDDFVILKLDGLPTYHFANIVDDHLMKITHVIRGEEWITSTPKHVALYQAFGWTPPQFIHIPLLTSLEDKKLSKRQGDIGILSMREKGILPEALVNFCALFGWSPPRPEKFKTTSEIMTLPELVKQFSLDNLTKGNAKVNDSKLYFFNKHHLTTKIANPDALNEIVDEYYSYFKNLYPTISKDYLRKSLIAVGPSLTTVYDLQSVHSYIFADVKYEKIAKRGDSNIKSILQCIRENATESHPFPTDKVLNAIADISKKQVFEATRFALSGGVSGLTIPALIELIGYDTYTERLDKAISYLSENDECK